MKVKKKVWAWLAAALAVFAIVMFGTNVALADVGDPPTVNKSRKDNHNGTYKIELSVTGDADDETESDSHVNVLIIYDESSSMSNAAGNDYSRADNAENAMYTFVNGLVGYQTRGVDIAMAEVGFGTGANTRSDWTTTLTTIRGHFDEGLDGRTNGGSHGNYGYNGTNWAQAFDRAGDLLDDLTDVGGVNRSSYPTFVVLVTDGAPTASPGNNTTVPGPNVAWINYRPHYRAAVEDAYAIQNRANTSLYGIYAFGTDANLLDDLMYYANTGSHRTMGGVNINTTNNANAYDFGDDDGADKYYTAANPAALDEAIADIFNQIVEVMGITEVSMSDGTTSEVKASSGEVTNLLVVDESSYQYWMSIPVDANNQFKRTKNVNGSAEEITYTVGSDGTVTWTEGGASKSVKLDGTPSGGQFKFEWTADSFPNDFYEFAPSDAELVGGAVEWDLSNVGVLLDGVTYSVTFDVYPSQTALDYKARLDNGEDYDNVVDEDLQQYFHEDGSLETNTDGAVTYSDSRDGSGPKTADFENPPAVPTEAESMKVKKEWEGATAPTADLKLDILMDGDEEHPFYEATLNSTGSWEATFNISAGLIVNGKALPGAMGHDFTFAELGDEQYQWELHAPTVRPMIIDGADAPTMLIKADADNGYDPAGKTQYTIDGATYYVDPAISTLTATNHRRSNLNLKKVVTGEGADPDATFPFTLKVDNAKAPESQPTDDPDHNSDYWVWFSIRDAEGNYVTTDANVGNATQSGNYFYAKSGDEITLDMRAGWNLRFTNLPSGTTYEFTEGNAEGFRFVSAANTGAADDTFEADGKKATGTIVTYNAQAYEVTYTNEYALVDVTVKKVWDDNSNQDGKRPDELTLTLNGLPSGTTAPTPTVTKDGNTWTYTWKGVPKYDDGGEVISYTVSEKNVPSDYECTGSPAKPGDTITNKHVPEVTTISVEKVWEGPEATATITLKADGTAVGNPITLPNAGSNEYTWENLPVYKNGKEIEYTVTEANIEHYDTEGPTGTGTANDPFTFTNTYRANGSVQLQAIKAISGAEWPEGKTLTLTLSGDGGTLPTTTTKTLSASGTVTFDAITYTEADIDKTYTYTISEDGFGDGWTATPESGSITATVKVTDKGDGTLDTEVTYNPTNKTITNTYEASGEATITVTKALAGAAWPAGKTLTLTLVGTGNAPMPTTTTATLTAAGDATFGPIAYSEADAGKTYTYTISEDGFGDGWSGSPNSITATVKVTDNGNGTLETEVTYDPTDATFTNTYQASGNATLKVTKALAGAAWPAGKTLTLTLTGSNGAPMPTTTTATLTAAGDVSFGPIAYTEADIDQEYTYTISEDGFGTGWTGSGDVTATVKVTDNGDGTLDTEVTYSPDDATITNTYTAEGEAVIEATKVLEGGQLAAGAFTFTLAPEGNAPMPENDTATNDANGAVKFETISYTEADAGKTYTYKITEVNDGKSGYTYATNTVTATVKVTDNGDGTLKTEVTYSPTNKTFTNSYKASGDVDLSVEKELEGRTLEAGQFTFDLYDANGNVIQTKTNDASGAVTFDTITYDQSVFPTTSSSAAATDEADQATADAATDVAAATDEADQAVADTDVVAANGQADQATADADTDAPAATDEAVAAADANADQPTAEDGNLFSNLADLLGFRQLFAPMTAYADEAGGQRTTTVTYTIKERNDGKKGYTYDTHEVKVTVTITDNGDGTLTAVPSYEGETTFKNTYKASGSATLKVTKELEGAAWPEGKTLTFTLSGEGGTLPTPATATLTEPGTATFGPIAYTEADAGKTYTYTITEDGFGDGWTGSGDVTATVKVTDNGDGTLKTEVTYTNDDTITNTYKAEGEAEIEVIKELEGSEWPEGETLTLTLTGEGGTLPETRTVELTAAGTATFDPISYTEADAGKTYTYTITEDGFGTGWTGSGNVTATVKVTDNGDGTLSTDITYSPEDATIINTYKPLPTWIDPPVKKVVTGDTPSTAETFNFTMTAGSDDTPMPDGKKGGTKSMSIKGAGEKEFGVIEYTEPGTYTYTITELAGSNKNYTYDSTSYTITVEVTDEGGQLVATVTGGENEAGLVTFTNTYRKPPTPPKPPVVPKTGDETPQTGMLFLLGAALLGYGVYRRRKA